MGIMEKQGKQGKAMETMIFDDKSMGVERFFIPKTPQNSSRVKSTDTGIIYNISDQEKNTKVFNSKFRLQREHDLSRKFIAFLEISAITLTVRNPIQIPI